LLSVYGFLNTSSLDDRNTRELERVLSQPSPKRVSFSRKQLISSFETTPKNKMRAKNLAVAALGSLLGDVVAQRTPNQRATGDSRIINGQPADVADYPFLVSIRASEDGELGICGGTVIAPNVVLTAAHCVTPEDPDEPLGSPYNSVNNYLMPLVVTAADVPANDPDLPIPTTNLVPTKAVVTSAGWADEL
jgi:hypothetical protein